ncbi:hypothetical protein [Nocardia alni]|uniref:hypothetical protein n=1 Tax=Nocardia alni TaxID=2815723 RepID=UPI0027DF9C19|nr:hypothetical protein [Nocardia alni]
MGAVPLALVVGCSSTTNQAGHTSTSEASATTAPTEESPAPFVPGTSTAPPPGQQQQSTTGPVTTTQPGVTSSWSNSEYTPNTVQPGLVQPSGPQPGVVTPLPNYVVPPDFRPVPDAEYTQPAPAVNLSQLHAPEYVAPVKPIAPPPRTLRVGNYSTPVPSAVPDKVLRQVNVTAARGEAIVATDMNSIGVNPDRSDRIAGTAAAGAAVGALVAGVPAAVAGGVVGGIIGGTLGTVASAPTVAGIPMGIAGGAAIGAVAGAAATGIPAAFVGGAVGAVAGAVIGAYS